MTEVLGNGVLYKIKSELLNLAADQTCEINKFTYMGWDNKKI